MNNIVISLGGSIVAPQEGPSGIFLMQFRNILLSWLHGDDRRAIIVVGGGAAARNWQKAYREFLSNFSEMNGDRGLSDSSSSNEALDRIGIAATRLNAQLVKEVFADCCIDPIITDPSSALEANGRILVAAGWKPGFSTDYDAVLLAERFSAKKVINLSNISQIYDSDPRINPAAKPLSRITFDSLIKMTGAQWNPGANVPFDPVAAARAREVGLRIIFASGTNLPNLSDILYEKTFVGTIIE